jgi:murein DD-endopeptidase MepM/ murein hydrolase activator NlpD
MFNIVDWLTKRHLHILLSIFLIQIIFSIYLIFDHISLKNKYINSIKTRESLVSLEKPCSTYIRAMMTRDENSSMSSNLLKKKTFISSNGKRLKEKKRYKRNNKILHQKFIKKSYQKKNYEENKLILPFKIYWPLKKHSFWISSPFGPRFNPKKDIQQMHWGVDLAAPKGTPVYPVEEGEVIMAESKKGYGKCIIVDHGEGIKTRYAHLSKININVGDRVDRSICIGLVGATGNTRGRGGGGAYHLHLELYFHNKRYDPLPYLSW